MDASFLRRDVVCFLAVMSAMLLVVRCGSEKKVIKDCVGQHVCTTLMRYPDGYVADEGPNCFCPIARERPCDDKWEEDPDSTLTWQHYERSHWTVQYKFCTPLFRNKPLCEPGKRAAMVTTEIKSWHPDLAEPRCRCPNNLFHIDGWKREGVQWKYFYSCEKPECPSQAMPVEEDKRTPCARIYVDSYKTKDKVLEVTFVCACPTGHMCPAHLKKSDNPDLHKDAKGTYVINYCEANKSADSTKS